MDIHMNMRVGQKSELYFDTQKGSIVTQKLVPGNLTCMDMRLTCVWTCVLNVCKHVYRHASGMMCRDVYRHASTI